MSTLVCFHAHPDDESIATSGSMARAVAEGHRVVLVVATRGELGEVADGFLRDGELLATRRSEETLASAAVLGVARVEFLGYVDSGMIGEASNDDPRCFWQAEVEGAAERLAAILREERADVLTVYDAHGNYGHPDHIQVHRVGVRAAQLADVPKVLESTMNRDVIRAQLSSGEFPDDLDVDDRPRPEEFDTIGSPASEITHEIDVAEWADAKRKSMRCHASQIAETSFFLRMPDELFRVAFGTEWYIEHGVPRAAGEPFRTTIFEAGTTR